MILIRKKKNFDPYLWLNTKIKFKDIVDLNVKVKKKSFATEFLKLSVLNNLI